MGKYGIILKYHANIPLVCIDPVDDLVVKADFSPLYGVKTRDHPEKGSFPTAGRT